MRTQPLSPPGLLWLFALLLLGVVTAGVQIDRATRDAPRLAAYTPPMFRVYEITSSAARAPESLSLRDTQNLIQKRPIPAEHLALLSLMQLERGSDEAAETAMLAAAARGWRVPMAQLYMMRLALSQDAWEIAAQRYDAVRRSNGAGLTPGDLDTFLADPKGQAELAARLRNRNEWIIELLREDSQTQDPARFADFVQRLKQGGVALSCPGLRSAAGTLLARDRPAEAINVWSGSCAARSASPLVATGLRPSDPHADGPFDWVYPNQGGIDRSFFQQAGRWHVKYANSDQVRRPLARRAMALPSGAHRIVLSHAATRSGSGRGPLASVRCAGASDNLAALGETLIIPAAGCPHQTVEIDVPPGEGSLTVSIR